MENLKALVKVISVQKIGQIEIIGQSKKKSTNYDKLYNAIRDGIVDNDQEAIEYLYPEHKNKSNYQRLKNRLINRLINSLFFIDTNKPSFTDYRRARHQVGKFYVAINLLLERSARPTAINIAEKVILVSKRFDFSEYTLLIARYLRSHYAYLNPNRKKYLHYNKIVEHALNCVNSEVLVEDIYSNYSYLANTSNSSLTKENLKQLRNDCLVLKKRQLEIDSFLFNRLTYELLVYEKAISKDHSGALKTCEEALDFFSQKPFKYQLVGIIFNYNIFYALVNLMKYKEAENRMQSNLDVITVGNFHWFRANFMLFHSLSLQEKYNELFPLLVTVLKHKNLTKYKTHFEAWKLNEAYVHLLIATGKIENVGPKKKFSINRFVNEVPIFSKDKRGRNISILILQLLFLIIQNKTSKITERLDALNQYCYRYLRNDETLRSNCFIKMLLKLPDADYHPLRVQRYVDKYHKRLLATPMEISEQSSEIEIIPYEQLWEMVLEVLEKNKSKRK